MTTRRQQKAEAAAADHTGRIGASRAAAVLGRDKYCSPVQAWLEIRGEPVERNPNLVEPAHWGQVLEDVVGREGYTRRTGRKLARVNRTLVHPKHEFITCHLDRRVLAHRPGRIYQGKCRDRFLRDEFGEEGTDNVPQAEMIQVCVEAELAHLNFRDGCHFGDLGVLFGGNEFVWFEIERDPELCRAIIDQLAEWHVIHIVEGREPEPLSEDDMRALWRRTHRESRDVTDADEDWLARFVLAEAEEKAAKKRKEKARFELRKLMGRTEELRVRAPGDGPPKWKTAVAWPGKWVVDEEKLREENEEVAKKYATVLDPEEIEKRDPNLYAQLVADFGVVDKKAFKKGEPKLWEKYRTHHDRGNLNVKDVARDLYLTNGDTDDDQ